MHVPGSSPRRWIRSLLLVAGCFAAVLGAKLAYVDRAATDLPNWDQWDAESNALLLPWLRGELEFADLFKPHNEHRTVPTKVLALGLFLANGQWDARLECVANAVIQSVIALLVFLGGRRWIDRRWHLAWFAGVLAFFAAPISWQNATGGFHTQQTFLIGFSLATVVLLVTGPIGSARWWSGLACALVSLVTMGSGLLAAVAAGATLAFIAPTRTVVRRHGVTIALLVGVAALGWFTRIDVSYHDPLKAQSLSAFGLCFWRSLQWPVVGFPPFPLLGWAPFGWLAWRVWTRKAQATPAMHSIVGAGAWVLLQFAASAYARGGTGDWPAIRYLDTVAIGLAVNVLALLVFLSEPRPAGWRHPARTVAALVGLVLLAHGWWVHIDDAINTTAPILARNDAEKQARTRAYLRTGDIVHLQTGIIPYPGAGSLAERLAPDEVRAILPASVRAPLPLAPDTSVDNAPFTDATASDSPPPGGWPIVGSFTAGGANRTGTWRSALLPASTTRYWLLPVFTSRAESAHLSVRLVDETGRTLQTILPLLSAAGEPRGWREVIIRAPSVASRLVATDGLADGWLAFGAPVEMAAGSCWAHRLAQSGFGLFVAGCGMTILGLGILVAARETTRTAWRRERELWRSMPRVRFWLAAVLGAGTGAAAATPLVLSRPPAYFDARVSGDLHKRSMELFFNRGRGIRGEDSVQVWFEEGETARHLHLRITPGLIRALRVDPMDHGATLTIEDARIVDANGAILRDLPPEAFLARSQIAALVADGGRLTVTSEPGALDSQLAVPLDPPLSTQPLGWRPWLRVLVVAGIAGLGCALGPSLFERARPAVIKTWRRFRNRGGRPPGNGPPSPGSPPREPDQRHASPFTIVAVGLAMKEDWSTRQDRTTNPVLLLITGLTASFRIVVLPVFAWRVSRLRTPPSWTVAGTVVACALVLSGFLVNHRKPPMDVHQVGILGGILAAALLATGLQNRPINRRARYPVS